LPRSRLIALLALAAVLLSGCKLGSWFGGNGVSKLSAQEIFDQAKSGADAATSVRVQGRLISEGQQVSIDMRVTQGQSARGVITMGGNTIELVRSGLDVYVKGSDGFYESIGIRAMPRQLQGKYLKVQAGNGEFASLTGLTDIRQIFDLFRPARPLTKGKKRKINGLRAIGLVEKGDGGRTLFVALQGQVLPVRITTRTEAGGSESIDFLEYNQPFTIAVPPKASVVDINQLTKAAA